MSATTAGRADARAESRAAANSSTLGCHDHRPTPARTSAISLFGFLRAEFIERPRIFRLGSFALAGDDDDGAVRFDLITGDCNGGPIGLPSYAGEGRLARLGLVDAEPLLGGCAVGGAGGPRRFLLAA